MNRPDVSTVRLRLKWRRAFERWERTAALWIDAIKAGFDPNQPRVPAGNFDGGQWTRTGGSSGGQILSDASPDNFWKPGARLAQADGKRPKNEKPSPKLYPPKKKRPSPVKKLTVPMPSKPSRGDGQLEPPPDIPPEKPLGNRKATKAAKRIGHWLQKARSQRARGKIGVVLRIIGHVGGWLLDHVPDMQSYFDEPRSLMELQDAVIDPLEGYEVHHIVPRNAPGLSIEDSARLDTAENLVRIPTWKHHEITVWFRKPSPHFKIDGENVSPEEFLKDKDWETRMRAGLRALREHGVLRHEND